MLILHDHQTELTGSERQVAISFNGGKDCKLTGSFCCRIKLKYRYRPPPPPSSSPLCSTSIPSPRSYSITHNFTSNPNRPSHKYTAPFDIRNPTHRPYPRSINFISLPPYSVDLYNCPKPFPNTGPICARYSERV